jgi:two-component system, LuxR family, response regulator FixJ
MLKHLTRSPGRKRLPLAQLQMLRPRRRLSALRRLSGAAEEAFPVYLVEPARSLRIALARDVRAAGFEVRPFATLEDFVDAMRELSPGCIVLDVAELEALALSAADEATYSALGCPMVLTFETLHADDAARAIRLGATDLLRRPVPLGELVAALRRAGPRVREQRARLASLGARRAIERLTEREREVMKGLMHGLSSKEIARNLGISHRTIEMHRRRLNEKLEVSSMAELLVIGWRAQAIGGLDEGVSR